MVIWTLRCLQKNRVAVKECKSKEVLKSRWGLDSPPKVSYSYLVLKEETHTTAFWWQIFRQIVAFCANPMKFQIAYMTVEEIAVGKREQGQDRHLGCELCRQVWCQSLTALWTLELSKSWESFLLQSKSFPFYHFCLHIKNTRLEWMISGSWEMLLDLCIWLSLKKQWYEMEW